MYMRSLGDEALVPLSSFSSQQILMMEINLFMHNTIGGLWISVMVEGFLFYACDKDSILTT